MAMPQFGTMADALRERSQVEHAFQSLFGPVVDIDKMDVDAMRRQIDNWRARDMQWSDPNFSDS